MPASSDGDLRICALLPSYNNARTLEQVIADVGTRIPDIIVVNDGSTDETSDILQRLTVSEVLTHTTNLGKGSAILTGLNRAHELGYTHAVTMDTDGQHRAEDLTAILNAIKEHPAALIIGDRDLSGKGRAAKSRILRANSNLWTWVETGHRIADSQCGFRVYPVESFSRIHFKRTRYDFEIENLVLALWNDIPVRSVPVKAYYGPGSESHFRPIVDFLRVARLNIHLIAERIAIPKSIRQRMHLKTFHEGTFRERWLRFARAIVLQESVTPPSFAACIGIGIFCGIFPVWGFQTALALVVAQRLSLSRTLTVLASNVSIPIFMPFILYFSILTGHFIFTSELDFDLALNDIPTSWASTFLIEYLVGSTVFALSAGLAGSLFAFVLSSLVMTTPRSTGAQQ